MSATRSAGHRPRPARWGGAVVRLLVVAVALSGVIVGPSPPAAEAARSSSAERHLVDLINAERAERGLDRLHVADDMARVAHRWSVVMADDQRMRHNPHYGEQICCWSRATENVAYIKGFNHFGGRTASLDHIHQMLMDSKGHRDNILDPNVTEVGVGVEERGNNEFWITQNFRRRSGTNPPPPSDPIETFPGGFVDVSRHATHGADIERLRTSGITSGCGGHRYCPDEPVTRAQMASFLVRALDLPSSSNHGFRDTAGTHAGAVAALAKAGITRGCNPPRNDRFCPDDPVTREQMATFLARALDLPAGNAGFRDTSGTHALSVSALADAGITRGCNPPHNDRFCPRERVTRAQMAAFLVRALDP